MPSSFDYAVVRVVPRVERGELINAGVIVSCPTQDYLAAIYDLAGSGKPVIGARLAKHMSISAPAVTEK